MSAFKSERDADAFALRAKHREWDDSDIEAVWERATEELMEETEIECPELPSDKRIMDRCIEILENRS